MYKIKQKPEDFVVREISIIQPSEQGKYSYFTLLKRNYNTEDSVTRVAEYFKIPRKFFGYAGAKDRRAVTEQLCSVKGMIRDIELNDIKVKVVGYGQKPISLGDLLGNCFEIVVRNIDNRPKRLRQIINYFDAQRFGLRGDNHALGRLIVKKDFKCAVEHLLEEDKYCLGDHLKAHENDYVGALRLIPKRILLMYVHAYQSYLWNVCVESFIKVKGNDIENIEFPIIGFGTEFEDKDVERICHKIMEREGISLRDFIIREIRELSCEGNSRFVYAEVKNLDIGELEDDELGDKKKVLVKFCLGAGSYATGVIKQMFSPEKEN